MKALPNASWQWNHVAPDPVRPDRKAPEAAATGWGAAAVPSGVSLTDRRRMAGVAMTAVLAAAAATAYGMLDRAEPSALHAPERVVAAAEAPRAKIAPAKPAALPPMEFEPIVPPPPIEAVVIPEEAPEPAAVALPPKPVGRALLNPLLRLRLSRNLALPVSASAAAPPEEAQPVAVRQERTLPANARADALYELAVEHLRGGDRASAESQLRDALAQVPGHSAARQALAAMLAEARRMEELEAVLEAGIAHSDAPANFAMAVARLRAERGDVVTAVVTLERLALPDDALGGEFLAMHAALLQRLGQHADAVKRFGAAIAQGNAKPAWHLGRAVSLRELGRDQEARAHIVRALASRTLSPALKAYAEKQLGTLPAPASGGEG